MGYIKKTFQFGNDTVTLETGEIARQASSVIVSVKDTVVLVTAVGNKDPDAARDFFPLTVHYQERAYAAGKIPGGFLRREGRPSDNETLIARLIDRPLRPLFNEAFTHEVQVVATVMSLDPEVSPDILSLIGASAALAISGLPFNGPIGAARVGYIHGEYVLNPSPALQKVSALDLVVAGTQSAVLMVESEAAELSEEIMLNAVIFGHQQQQVVIQAIRELAAEVATPAWNWQAPPTDQELGQSVHLLAFDSLTEAYQISDKMQRQDRVKEIRKQTVEQLTAGEAPRWTADQVKHEVENLAYRVVRDRILDGHPRIDGRDTKTVRPITSKVGVLPRTHGSALFTRGETQALVVATLGTERDAQIIDAIGGEYRDSFMLQYNFPPYCVGECGQIGSPKRREIGHGRLAKRGVQAMMPDPANYPYVVRVVSEITESNGSSSMASVCGTSMALMDAGVPIKAPVAGIAMGLIKEGDKFQVLSDIMGDEDHLGDMDFKVAGTANGVTALQMDIKIEGITSEIMKVALDQAMEGRLHILSKMAPAISEPRQQISEFAPRITTIRISPDKIRDVIGKGGVTIRSITEETGVSIDIDDDGSVRVAATSKEATDAALARIKELTSDIEVGTVYTGKVVRIMDFGAFVSLMPGRDGMVHISQICDERLQSVGDRLAVGDEVTVKVLEIDKQGRIRLTMRDI